MTKLLLITVLLAGVLRADKVSLPGLLEPVEVLRDRWGVPHIYARNSHDLFFAQGYITARDRLFQIDLWRRIGSGRLAEVLGPQALARDRIARLVSFRGDWEAEWRSYSPDARDIAVAFTEGINACVRSLGGRRPLEFRLAGYDPGLWSPEDIVSRIAGLVMIRNLAREVSRARDARDFGIDAVARFHPPDPFIRLEVPAGLNLADITPDILKEHDEAVRGVSISPLDQGSNNWVVAGARTVTGKPLLANDPHRPIQIPSLRKTVHLSAPGWNAFGAGEPALPGVALGHNDRIAFGFTIVGIDQGDLYVEKLNPANPNEYLYRGKWRRVEVVRERIPVKGSAPKQVELRFTLHGPILHEDPARRRAYALRWVGAEPGGAGYLAALAVARARDWSSFLAAMESYKVPSENMIYADVEGNIGWVAAGQAPVRKNWSGLFPVPGDTGDYEWSGFLPFREMPRRFNPPEQYIATANANILPPGYRHALSYDWAQPFRFERVREMLEKPGKFSVSDFERMQQDVVSLPARRLQAVLRRVNIPAARPLLDWDCRMSEGSAPAVIFAYWMARLPEALFGPGPGARAELRLVLETLEKKPDVAALSSSLEAALRNLERDLGADRSAWRWGRVHQLKFTHAVNHPPFHRGPFERPGDANTVNAASGAGFLQTNGASYRQILDTADWDRSVMTNVPGESGDPSSTHYSDLLDGWSRGRYHPMPFSRKAVEAATEERIELVPLKSRTGRP